MLGKLGREISISMQQPNREITMAATSGSCKDLDNITILTLSAKAAILT